MLQILRRLLGIAPARPTVDAAQWARVEARLPFPDPGLNFRDVQQLAKGDTAAHRKLKQRINTFLGGNNRSARSIPPDCAGGLARTGRPPESVRNRPGGDPRSGTFR